MLHKGIVLLGSALGQWLEPVRIMRYPVFLSPELHAGSHNLPIALHPDTGADLMQLQVPLWKEHLLIGAQAYEMTGLGYLGADIVLDRDRGPMMLELNARPGLSVQIANGIGLQPILQKIEETYPKDLTPQERVEFVLNN